MHVAELCEPHAVFNLGKTLRGTLERTTGAVGRGQAPLWPVKLHGVVLPYQRTLPTKSHSPDRRAAPSLAMRSRLFQPLLACKQHPALPERPDTKFYGPAHQLEVFVSSF
jgi:hypothetical protein